MELAKKGKKGQAPRSVKLEVMFWMEDDLKIHLSTNDKNEATENFHVYIASDGTKPGGHPNLYKNLLKCLQAAGARMPE